MTMPYIGLMSRAAQRVEIVTGAGGRREWSPAQKAAILTDCYSGSASVCDVARRHGLDGGAALYVAMCRAPEWEHAGGTVRSGCCGAA